MFGYSSIHAITLPPKRLSPKRHMLAPHATAHAQDDLSTRGLGGEVGLEVRSLANLSATAVASILRPLATGAGGAGGLAVFVARTAASALAGRTLVCHKSQFPSDDQPEKYRYRCWPLPIINLLQEHLAPEVLFSV